MMDRKDFAIVVLVALILAAVLVPTLTVGQDYDPWSDITDDGKIRVDDILDVALRFGSDGDATKRAVIEGYNWSTIACEIDIPGETYGDVNIATAGYREITLGFAAANPVGVEMGFFLGSRYAYVDRFNISGLLKPLAPNAWWLEPSEVASSARMHPIGHRFNVTVWTSCDLTEIYGWQFLIVYDKNYLNATGAGYTRPDLGKSDFFKNITTYSTTPYLIVYNTTHNLVIHAEIGVFPGPYRNPGYGSCSWVEFEVVAHPPVGGKSLELAFDPEETFWIDSDQIYYREGWHNGLYTITWDLLEYDVTKTYTVRGPILNVAYYNPNQLNVTLTMDAYITN